MKIIHRYSRRCLCRCHVINPYFLFAAASSAAATAAATAGSSSSTYFSTRTITRRPWLLIDGLDLIPKTPYNTRHRYDIVIAMTSP
jgi:hypothetical protein